MTNKIKISSIKPNPDNPRIVKDDKFYKLVESIKQFGEKMFPLRPIVVDENNIILGGNMRYKALKHLKYRTIPETWIKQTTNLTDDEKKEFIIKDNVGFGLWDWDLLSSDWDSDLLDSWAVDIPNFNEIDIDEIEVSDSFILSDADKEPFQQMTFTFADEQAIFIKNSIADIKKTEEFKYMETMGNENGNGNALYLLITTTQKTNL